MRFKPTTLSLISWELLYSQWNTPAATDLIVADYALEGLRRISRAVMKHKHGVCLAQVVNTENKLQADTDKLTWFLTWRSNKDA